MMMMMVVVVVMMVSDDDDDDDDDDNDDDDDDDDDEECIAALPTFHVRNNEMHFHTSVSGALQQRLWSAHHVSTAHMPFGHGVSARRIVYVRCCSSSRLSAVDFFAFFTNGFTSPDAAKDLLWICWLAAALELQLQRIPSSLAFKSSQIFYSCAACTETRMSAS